MTKDSGRGVSAGGVPSKAGHRAPRLRITGLVAMLMLFAAPIIHASTVFSDPFAGSGGDQVTRGFYIQSYAGTNLSTVTLGYVVHTPGSYTTSLTARLGSYNGPIIGATQTKTTTLGLTETLVTYNFGGAAVPTGSLVTFTQQVVSGPDVVFYDLGTGAAGVIETVGTTPPLDTFFGNSVGVTITQQDPPPTTPVPPSLILVLTGMAGAGLYSARKRWGAVFSR
jgi:hypothetical protein